MKLFSEIVVVYEGSLNGGESSPLAIIEFM